MGLLAAVAAASTTDRPIKGLRLVLKSVGTKSKLVFVARDPSFLFPAIGGPDDPVVNGGVTIELFSRNQGYGGFNIEGTPGWAVKPGNIPTYTFQNEMPSATFPAQEAILRKGRLLKVIAKGTSLSLAGAQGAVGVRIIFGNYQSGSLRNCALFDGGAIRRDKAGVFLAVRASAAGLSNCSAASLGGPPVACGQTTPACDGTCPAGEECASVGPGFFPQCFCLPAGSTPCGDTGPPVCGGVCPSGSVCRPALAEFGGGVGCLCATPGQCGSGGADCPNGYFCAVIPQTSEFLCLPIGCDDNPVYPTCGGTCISGAACQPVKSGSATLCVCAVPAPCDTSCGGGTCPAGEVCQQDTAACTCSAP